MTAAMMTSQVHLLVMVVVVAGLLGEVAATNWNEYPTLLKPAVVEANQNFGMTLALDDNYLVIGTDQEDESGVTDMGTVTIFRQQSGTWGEMDQIVPTLAGGGAVTTSVRFGYDVNIDSGVLIVGYYENAIAIYRYVSSAWQRDELKEETDAADVSCGRSVEIYGNYAAYGCPSVDKVKVYKLDGGNYFASSPAATLTKTGPEFFGDELAMYGDYLAVSSQNKIYVYRTDDSGASWVSDAEITVSPLLRKDGAYGRALSMYDGRLVVATTVNNDATVKTYKRTTTTAPAGVWNLDSQVFTLAYTGVSVSIYGTKFIAGFYNHRTDNSIAGSGRVYELSGDTWSFQTSLTGHDIDNGDHYGRSVATRGDYFVTGSPYDGTNNGGAVYIFDSSASTVVVNDVSGTISLSFTMALYTDQTYTTAITGTQTVDNNNDVYVGVKETVANSYFKFIVKRCWATQSTSGSSSPSYDLYNNRCPQDESFTEVTTTNDEYNFKFRAFDFLAPTGSSIYVHCELLICLTTDTSTSCTQSCATCASGGCPFSRRKRRSVGKGALANFVLASRRIVFVPRGCSNSTCPAHSTCLSSAGDAPSCVCNDGYVMSVKTLTCMNDRVIRVDNVPFPLSPAGARTASTNLTDISAGHEKMLWEMMKRDCRKVSENIFDGVRLINARRERNGVVFDVLLLYKQSATNRSAYDKFTRFLTAMDLQKTAYSYAEDSEFQNQTEKRILNKWVHILLIVGGACAAMILVPMSLFVMRRMKHDSLSLSSKETEKTDTEGKEIGTDNSSLDVMEKNGGVPVILYDRGSPVTQQPLENPYS